MSHDMRMLGERMTRRDNHSTNQSIVPATARTDSHVLAHALDRRLADDGGHGGLARARPRVPADDLAGGWPEAPNLA